MTIYPLLINLKAPNYQKSIRVSENNTTPIREIYLILPHSTTTLKHNLNETSTIVLIAAAGGAAARSADQR